ncbi:LysE family translocator [Psychromonas ossibalaenae]|uniref:LysE family translocator n=1 Tax=Psychromonas ossibalaenae TaxID=444922 RepID=UPI0003823A17|nr:LysE family translocator [Psychromonas ossibalaenae]
MLSIYITYAVSIAILISTPGPLIALIISDSKHGWPSGTILGSALASLILLVCALIALNFAVSLDPHLLEWGRVIGGCYLIYLGLTALRKEVVIDDIKSHNKNCFWRAMRAGISNPKDILFFVAFLPSFVIATESFTQQALIFLVLWVVIDVSIMVTYAKAAKKLLSYAKCRTVLFYLPAVFMPVVGGISLYLGAKELWFV